MNGVAAQVRRGEFRRGEVAAALAASALVLAASGLALRGAVAARREAVPVTHPDTLVPVRITPVVDLDAPILKLGGKRDPTRLPDRWVRPHATPRVEQKSYVSTKASKDEHDIPPRDVAVADAGTPLPPPDAAIAKQVDVVSPPMVDAGAPANVDVAGHADGLKEGTETDPLKARAVDLYRAKIAAWFSSRFGVHGSGLARDQLLALRVPATVQIGADHQVTGFSITPSGNATFDAAARATLEGAKGQTLPPPPENYPEVEQHQISVTFVCRGNRCD
jgi:hypothetical protein